MATWDKDTLAKRVLEDLGIIGEGQDPSAVQQSRVEEVIDSIYQRLRPKGLVPFALATIPLWAQVPLRDVVAGKSAPRFGYGGARLQERLALAKIGMDDLADGSAGKPTLIPPKTKFY